MAQLPATPHSEFSRPRSGLTALLPSYFFLLPFERSEAIGVSGWTQGQSGKIKGRGQDARKESTINATTASVKHTYKRQDAHSAFALLTDWFDFAEEEG